MSCLGCCCFGKHPGVDVVVVGDDGVVLVLVVLGLRPLQGRTLVDHNIGPGSTTRTGAASCQQTAMRALRSFLTHQPFVLEARSSAVASFVTRG